MTHIRNRFDIQNDMADETLLLKKRLPNYFLDDDGLSGIQGFLLSVAIHILLIVIALSLSTFVFSKLPKPMPPTRDIEFKLVQAEEKPPINKNTKIRSDRNSQAGGKHDPKRPISEPGKTSANKKQVKSQAAPKSPAKKLQNIIKQSHPQNQKPQIQPQVKQQAQQKQTVKKPTPVSAPSAAKPSVKPSNKPSVAAPQAPKFATAPKSPFTVPVPKTNAPVGSTYRQGTPGATGTSGGSSGTPAPKFSSTSGSGSRSGSGSSGSAASRGSSGSSGSRGSGGGVGSGNNPGPGNPNGTPGIDALKQPNWGPYMRDLEQRIKRNWTPPKGDTSKRVVILFTIAKDGRLLSKKISKSSGLPLADQAALKAIESTAPFRPLPPEFRGTSVPIEFTFDYNVINSSLISR